MPLQNYEEELILVFVINATAMTVMIMLLASHIKDLKMNSKVFPFMALTLTPLIMLHVFTIDVNMADVVKLQMKALFKILTYDFFDVKSHMSG